MSNYYVSELYPDARFTAGALREDIETVLKQEGFARIDLPAPANAFAKVAAYMNVPAMVRKLHQPGNIFFHFPLRSRLVRSFFDAVSKQGFNTIAYVHDFEGLRDEDDELLKKEMEQLAAFTAVIAQNEAMRNIIAQQTTIKNIVVLEMYDYLHVDAPMPQRTLSSHISFAGNLAKASFIYQLKELAPLPFSIYGQGVTAIDGPNVTYKGTADPRTLPTTIEGSFGLVWDGSSIDTGKDAGAYLRYNIPHKLALYIMAGLPPIVWTESAMASWVTKNRIGIAVSSLREMKQVIDNLSEADYEEMRSNMIELRRRMSEGFYLKSALTKC